MKDGGKKKKPLKFPAAIISTRCRCGKHITQRLGGTAGFADPANPGVPYKEARDSVRCWGCGTQIKASINRGGSIAVSIMEPDGTHMEALKENKGFTVEWRG